MLSFIGQAKPPAPPTRGLPAWAYCVLLAEVLVFHRQILFSARYMIPWDLVYYHQPLAWFASQRMAVGELPLWDPFTYCGRPLYANLTLQLFYPPTTLIYALGAGRHVLYLLEVQIVLHVLLAGVFTLWLLRRLGAGTAAALVGATVYQLGAYFASQAQHLGAVDAAAWLPAAWLAVTALAEGYSARRLAGLATALAMSFLAGFPAATAVVYGSTALLALLLMATRRARWPLVAWCAIAIAATVPLCAVQLFPTLELRRQSVAALRTDWMGAGGGLPAGALLTLVAPDYFGVFTFRGDQWKLPWSPTFLYVYCGLPALAFAAVALARRRSAFAWPFAAMLLGSALWMLGDATPVYRAVFAVLPASLKAGLYAEFALGAFTLALAVLAGLGAARVLAGRSRVWAGAAVLLAAADLTVVSSGRPLNTADGVQEPGVGHDYYDRYPEIPARLRGLTRVTTPPLRIDTMHGALPWSTGASLFEVPTANGDDPFALDRYMRVRRLFTGGERWGRYYQVRDPDSPVLKLLNVGYVLSNGPLAAPGTLERVADLPGTRVHRVPGPLPRFFLVAHVRHAADAAEAARLLSAPDFAVRTEAVVEGAAPQPRASGEVRVVEYSPRRVVLETVAADASFLVSSEAWYPGWRARIDGRAQPLTITNAAFRGLAVPAGRHSVEMEFAPTILWWSAAVSAVTWLLMLAVVVRDNRRHRASWNLSSSSSPRSIS